MKPDAYMPFYGDDFEAATKGWSAATKWGYLSCLWNYWAHTHCNGLLNDDEFLRILCECDKTDWMRTKGMIFDNDLFFRLENGRWHQKRARQYWLNAVEAYTSQIARTEKARRANLDNQLGAARLALKPPVTIPVTGQQPEPEPLDRDNVAVELPPGFPKTEQEAKIAAQFVGCPESFAITTWNKARGRAGRDSKDVPIRSWPHYLKSEFNFQNNRIEKENKNGNHAKIAPDRNAGTYNADRVNQPVSKKIR